MLKKYKIVLIVLFLLALPFIITFYSKELQTQITKQDESSPLPNSSISPSEILIHDPSGLSTNDLEVKRNILSLLKEQTSGVLYESKNVRIDYTKGPDLIQAEILTDNVEDAKKEAVGWFLSKGMSQQGVCSLPVDFYLNWEIRGRFEQENKTFNSIPYGC